MARHSKSVVYIFHLSLYRSVSLSMTVFSLSASSGDTFIAESADWVKKWGADDTPGLVGLAIQDAQEFI